MSYRKLPWDSEFFDLPIGRLDSRAADSDALLTESTAAADADGVRCLYLLLPADDITSLHRALAHGFRPYDIRIELDSDLGRTCGAPPPPDATRAAVEADLPALEGLARKTMRGTRFTSDPGFPPDRVAELYAAWARRGVLEPSRRRAIVTVPELTGFVICDLDPEERTGTIELIGVSPTHARRGLGSALVGAARDLFVTERCRRATVVTQGRNVPALRLYQAHGYRTRYVSWWLHRWQ